MTEVTAKKVILKDKNGQYLIPYTDNNLNNPYTLFDSKYSEAPLYNASWLLSNGTYYSKSVYVTAYEALVVENNTEIDAGTSVQLPSGTTYIKRGLSVKLSTAEDITDYDFVINTTNETFRLPLKNKIIPLTGESIPVKGNGIALGMMTYDGDTPHYYGTYEFGTDAQLDIQAAVYGMSVGDTSITNINVYPVGRHAAGITDDATKSGMIADISNMDLSDLNLYYYVGETVQNANLINAGVLAEVKADKTDVDGQWVFNSKTLSTNGNAGTINLDLSNILPNDNYCYELLISHDMHSSNSTLSRLYYQTDIYPRTLIGAAGANGWYSVGMSLVITGSSHSLSRYIDVTTSNKLITIILIGYRRLGKNN